MVGKRSRVGGKGGGENCEPLAAKRVMENSEEGEEPARKVGREGAAEGQGITKVTIEHCTS